MDIFAPSTARRPHERILRFDRAGGAGHGGGRGIGRAIERAKRCPMGRGGQAEDFIGTALWLASAVSAWITGVLLRVDGGAHRQMS